MTTMTYTATEIASALSFPQVTLAHVLTMHGREHEELADAGEMVLRSANRVEAATILNDNLTETLLGWTGSVEEMRFVENFVRTYLRAEPSRSGWELFL